MSPAVQLGADKILIVGVKYREALESSGSFSLTEPNAYPSFTHLAGKLLDALFLDHIDYDLEQMNRINKVVEWSEKLYGPNYLHDLNEMLKKEGIAGATVLRGIAGFGKTSVIHTTSILRLSTDLPIVIEITDKKENIDRIRPKLDEVIEEGLITEEKVRIVLYEGKKKA